MKTLNKLAIALVAGAVSSVVAMGEAVKAAVLVDRGLPSTNLNNAAGPNRSNIRWATDAQNAGLFGDDFTIGNAGENFQVDTITTWVAPGLSIGDPVELGDFFSEVTLLGAPGSGSNIAPISTGTLSVGSSATSNSNISISQVTYSDGSGYDNFGTEVNLWQVDFNNLGLNIAGGEAYSFGVRGVGRQIGASTLFYPWFNHGSNAALSGVPQDAADNLLSEYDASGNFVRTFDSTGDGWDKPSDLNIRVSGKRVPLNI